MIEEIINFGKYFITIGNLRKNSFCVTDFFIIIFIIFILFLFYFTVHGISTGNEIKIVEEENKKGGKVTSTTVFVRNTKLMNPIFWKCEVVRRAKCNLYILLLNVYIGILNIYIFCVTITTGLEM